MSSRYLAWASTWLLPGLGGCGHEADAPNSSPTTSTASATTTADGTLAPATATTDGNSSTTGTTNTASATVATGTATTTTGVGGNGAVGTDSATGTGGVDATATSATAGTTGSSGGTAGGTGSGAFPFPRNAPSDYCIYPSYDNGDVRDAYTLWKETVITSEGAGGFLRVKKPDSGSVIGSTVSEGIGYGMLLAVYMGDQEVFDNLWQYAQLHFNGNGLMDWEVHPDGHVIGTGAALDGDEDMAWALVMADRQWGTSSALSDPYAAYASALITAMWDHEIDHNRDQMPLPGDSWGGADIANISYFAPAYYRVFGEVTNNVAGWQQAIDTSYAIIERSLNQASGNADNGLVPAWCNSAGEPVEAFGGAPTHFQNDSTRTPFRVGQDYCYYGEPRALAYMQKITSFYQGVGVSNIVDGYDLDGTPHPDFSMNGSQAASFVGPAGVGAMYSPTNQAFVDEAYLAVATGELTAGTIYYQKSWSALSLLMMTGNFTELPPSP